MAFVSGSYLAVTDTYGIQERESNFFFQKHMIYFTRKCTVVKNYCKITGDRSGRH